jgi:scyllo-inositol 2-dehydrogenase (NADP+)
MIDSGLSKTTPLYIFSEETMAFFTDASQIKVGVIGYSPAFNMGRGHMTEAQRAGMVPTAVADLSEDNLAQAKVDFPGIKTYRDGNALIDDPDVNLVILIIPHNIHAEYAVKALKKGKHVVAEKPFAITTDECDAMIDAAKASGLMVSTYHNRHWDGCILEAIERIRGGAIGDVVRIEAHMGGHRKPGDWWRSSKSISGGVLYDWGVHLLEYSLQILHADIAEVSAVSWNGYWADQTTWKGDTNEDESTAFVRMKNGTYMTLRISSIDVNPRPGQLEIYGTKGVYIMDQRSWKTIVPSQTDGRITTEGVNRESEGWRFYRNVADHLTAGESLVITPEWARRPIHILDLADRSSREGRAIGATYA